MLLPAGNAGVRESISGVLHTTAPHQQQQLMAMQIPHTGGPSGLTQQFESEQGQRQPEVSAGHGSQVKLELAQQPALQMPVQVEYSVQPAHSGQQGLAAAGAGPSQSVPRLPAIMQLPEFVDDIGFALTPINLQTGMCLAADGWCRLNINCGCIVRIEIAPN